MLVYKLQSPQRFGFRNNSSDRKHNNLLPTTLIALAGNTNTLESSIITSPPVLDGEESGRGDSCASFEFIGRTKAKPVVKAFSVNGASAKQQSSKQVNHFYQITKKTQSNLYFVLQRSLEKRTRNDSDSILECNKLGANFKRSPSFKEADEIKELLEERDSLNNRSSMEKTKRDGSSQTDKKDMRRMLSSPSSNRDRHSPNSKVNNIEEGAAIGPFEREIQKLLEEQNLLQNIPPKHELVHQGKELALEPLIR